MLDRDGVRGDAEAEVRRALRSHPVTASLGDARLTPIAGGLSNFAWQAVTSSGEPRFVRLGRRQGEALGADHASEARVLVATAGAGLSPPLVHCDPEARLLVTDWIDDAVPGRVIRRGAELRTIATALARLHSLQVPAAVRTVDFARQAAVLQAALDHATTRHLASRASEVVAALAETPVALALCHNDLNPFNLLWDAGGRLWIVDWEYAGLGDPAFDLASVASQHGLDARGRRQLVRAYGEAGGRVRADRLERALWLFDFVQWLWYRAALEARDGVNDPSLAGARADRLEASLRTRARRVLRCNNAAFAG